MKYRKLRIAWSVGMIWFVMVSLLVIAQAGPPLENWAYNDGAILPVLAVIVAIPWLPWSKQFSLRTLLIATTLVAVVLGLIVWMSRAA